MLCPTMTTMTAPKVLLHIPCAEKKMASRRDLMKPRTGGAAGGGRSAGGGGSGVGAGARLGFAGGAAIGGRAGGGGSVTGGAPVGSGPRIGLGMGAPAWPPAA